MDRVYIRLFGMLNCTVVVCLVRRPKVLIDEEPGGARTKKASLYIYSHMSSEATVK